MLCHFMQIVSFEGIFYEMPRPVFWEKKKKISSMCRLLNLPRVCVKDNKVYFSICRSKTTRTVLIIQRTMELNQDDFRSVHYFSQQVVDF